MSILQPDKRNEIYKKHELLASLLKKKEAEFLLVEAQENYSWITSGRGFIGLASTQACCSVLVDMHGFSLIANNIELSRLKAEQGVDHPLFRYYSFPWYENQGKENILKNLVKDKRMITEREVTSELYVARTTLSDDEIARYEEICMTTALELEAACRDISKGMSEYELCGVLSNRFWKKNLEPITLLIGFDERAYRYRHPVPAGALLENYALIAVCTRRDGLIASATRLVTLNRDDRLMDYQKISTAIESFLISQTNPGSDLADIFARLQAKYAELGVEEEWQKHHQGGLTGFVARELKAEPGKKHIVRLGEVYGWNPSVLGTKSENTILVEDDGARVLTHTGYYPYIEHIVNNNKYLSEDILILNE